MFTKILAIGAIILFVIPFLLRSIIRFIFGGVSSQKRSSQSNRNTSSSRTQKPPPKKKFIPDDEGEYIDYEVIKDK